MGLKYSMVRCGFDRKPHRVYHWKPCASHCVLTSNIFLQLRIILLPSLREPIKHIPHDFLSLLQFHRLDQGDLVGDENIGHFALVRISSNLRATTNSRKGFPFLYEGLSYFPPSTPCWQLRSGCEWLRLPVSMRVGGWVKAERANKFALPAESNWMRVGRRPFATPFYPGSPLPVLSLLRLLSRSFVRHPAPRLPSHVCARILQHPFLTSARRRRSRFLCLWSFDIKLKEAPAKMAF